MKTKISPLLFAAFLLSTLSPQLSTGFGQSTAITYQGRLNDAAGPASGKYDFQFTVRDALTDGNAVGVNPIEATLTVSNGLFTATLDPGAGVFTGADRWLEIAVRPTGDPLFTTLSPRQKITATPYAITAGTVTGTIPLAQLPATVVTNGASGVTISGAFSGNGAGLTDLNASQLAVGTVPAAALGNAWKLGGNAGTTPGTHFLGTTDNLALELKVNGERVLRMEPTSSDSPNVIGGASVNGVGTGVKGATIGGGGTTNFLGLTSANQVAADFATIGGGSGNRIQPGANHAFVGSGWSNLVRSNAYQSVLVGGQGNDLGNAYAVIGGGVGNTNTGYVATIAGGLFNTATTNGATVGGGGLNAAAGVNATVVGGFGNTVTAEAAFVGGGNYNTNSGDNSVLSGGTFNLVNSDYSMIGGGRSNSIPGTSSSGSTISGGLNNSASASFATIGGGRQNRVFFAVDAVVGGGVNNLINLPASGSTISGGSTNSIENTARAVIAGGSNNRINDLSSNSSVGGGDQNLIFAGANSATIAGGFENTVSAADFSSIGGGYSNLVSGTYATVPGGARNIASGPSSQAAGYRARATHGGSFVWADDTDADFASTTNKQFAVRVNNGVMIQATNTALDLRGGGGIRVAGAGVNTTTPIFTHQATVLNTSGSETRISHPHCSGKPNAILIVTYNYNPAGQAGTRNDRPVGIYYTGTQWAIYNLDATAMPVGAAYNVLVANP